MTDPFNLAGNYETYDGAYAHVSTPEPLGRTPEQEDADWRDMREALPARLGALGMSQAEVETFIQDNVPEQRREPVMVGAILQSSVTHPAFVTYGPEPVYHIFGGEAFERAMSESGQALFTDTQEGEK